MRKPVAVVHVVNTSNFAGVERHVVTLANQQAATGLAVSVVGGRAGIMQTELSPRVEYSAFETLLHSARLVRRLAPDVVHSHMTSAETSALLARTGSHVVTTRHFAARRGRTIAGRAMASAIRARVERQISVSRFVQESVDGDSVVVHNGVSEASLCDNHATRTILVAQRLAAEKSTEVAVRAFAVSRLAAEGWRLVVAGDGPCRRSVEQTAADVEGATLVGFRADLLSLLNQASILLAPAPAEPFGLSVVEAMARGVPVVAADGGAHRETVGRASDAILFAPGDADRAAHGLRLIATERARAETYGRELQAIQRADFTPQIQARRTWQVYEGVLNS